MSMTIAHNMSAMNTQRQFSVSANGMSSSMQKLSSGYKINTGKDDPAGLLISEKLRSQLNGIERATQNTEEAMNVMNIAEGAMNEMNNILKTMKTLATHSANSGVTTSDQVAADQVEMDSAIQTIDRIAQTTEFSNEKLLNGNKEIDYTASTTVKGTQQNSLLNARESEFNQIYKRSDYQVSISYTGAAGAIDRLTDTGEKVDFAKQATKAYMEVDTGTCMAAAGAKPQIRNGTFTQTQVFTLTGSQGSRQFTVPKGQSIASMVADIHSAAGSTGVDAALIFNSDQKITQLETTGNVTTDLTSDAMFTGNNAVVFGNQMNSNGTVKNGLMSVDTSGITASVDPADNSGGIQWGMNTDGQGNIYLKFISETEVELYKDSSMSAESLVGTANGTAAKLDADGAPIAGATPGTTWTVQESNNSGLGGLTFTVGSTDGELTEMRGLKISTGGLNGASNSTGEVGGEDITWSGNAAGVGGAAGAGKVYDQAKTVITGIELGTNTSSTGQLFFKTTINSNNEIQAFAYKDKEMTQMVAQSEVMDYGDVSTAGLILNEVRNSDNTAGTGLSILLGFNWDGTDGVQLTQPAPGTSTSYTGDLTFNNLGARIFSTEYGSNAYIKITQDDGGIFSSFDVPGNSERTLLESGENGSTKLIKGQDATVTVNGKEVKTNGLELKVATQDIQADLTFNSGKVGSTTLAQVGYDTGSLFTKAGVLNLGANKEITVDEVDAAGNVTQAGNATGYEVLYAGLSGLLCNAGHNTTETVGDFQGGMQLQLGEGSGDQNRTVVSLKSMTSENLGRTVVGGYWDTSNPTVYTNKTLTLKDCMGGGFAALSDDPTLTMKIIDKAIDDVSTQRAVLGAMQSNLLQTNINNLEVTLENVTATEAGIRDTDMASEMSEFTKNQVLQSAAMSMMSQANSQGQQVLQLLQ